MESQGERAEEETDVSHWSTVMFMSHLKGSAHFFCLRVASVICKVHGGVYTNCKGTKKGESSARWQMRVRWYSHGSIITYTSKVCSVFCISHSLQKINTVPFSLFPLSINYIVQSDVKKKQHISYQIIIQTAAQMKIWQIAFCCDSATRHRQTLVLSVLITTLLFHYNWWSGSNRKLIKINIVSAARVHRFSTLLSLQSCRLTEIRRRKQ